MNLKDKILVSISKKGVRVKNIHTEQVFETNEIEGFLHPRCIISDVEKAQKSVKQAVKKVTRFRLLSPEIIIEWGEKIEGGLSPVEMRALIEIGEYAGAGAVYLYDDTRDLMGLTLRDFKKI